MNETTDTSLKTLSGAGCFLTRLVQRLRDPGAVLMHLVVLGAF